MPKTRRVPMRTCVACRQARPKRDLIRVVRTPDGVVRVDSTGKVSGRGAYVCRDATCTDVGLREERLAHALEVAIPGDVAAELRQAAGGRQAEGAYH